MYRKTRSFSIRGTNRFCVMFYYYYIRVFESVIRKRTCRNVGEMYGKSLSFYIHVLSDFLHVFMYGKCVGNVWNFPVVPSAPNIKSRRFQNNMTCVFKYRACIVPISKTTIKKREEMNIHERER